MPSFGSAGAVLTPGAGASAVIAAPAGAALNDIIVVRVYRETGTTITPPAGEGFTLIDTAAVTTGNAQWHAVFWKRSDGSEPATYTFTWSGSAWRSGVATRYTGCATSGSPIDAYATANSGGSAPANTPAVSLTTLGPDRLIEWSATNWDNTTWTHPGSYTPRVSGDLIAVATRDQAVAGSTGSVSGQALSNPETQTAFLLALKPAATDVAVADPGPGSVQASDPGGETVEALTNIVTLTGLDETGAAQVSDPAAELVDVATEPDPAVGHASGGDLFGEIVDVATAEPAPTPVQVSDPAGEDAFAEELTLPPAGRVALAFFHVDPDTRELTPLPHRVGAEVSPDYRTAGAVRIEYPKRGLNSDKLWSLIDGDTQIEVEIWLGNRSANAMHAILTEGSVDDVSEQGFGVFAGSFVEYLLAGLRLRWEASDPEGKGATVVQQMTPGEFVGLLMARADARGALGGVADFTWDSFSNTHDSNGTPWAEQITGSFAPGPSYLEIFADLAESAVFEFEVATLPTGQRDLRLYTFGSRGRDRTTGPAPAVLRRGRNFLDVARKRTSRDVVTDVEVYGKDGLRVAQHSETARARYGRVIEGADSAGEIDVPGALESWGEKVLQLGSSGLLEVSAGLVYGVGDPQPQNGFKVADWVLVDFGLGTQDRPALEPMRVAEWSLTESGSDQDGTISLNDLIEDWRSRIRRRLDRMQRGSVQIGSSTSPPQVPDVTPPGAPTGLVASSDAYQDDANGETWATLQVSYVAPLTNADNSDDPRTQAAVLILAGIEDEPPINEDWSWTGAPEVVLAWNDYLNFEWIEAGGGTGEGQVSAEDWLTEYIATNAGAPTPVDDLAGFQARYRYLGLTQTGGSGDVPDESAWLGFNVEAGPSQLTMYTDGLNPGAAVEIQVRAFDDAELTNYGPWSESVVLTTAVDNTPPEQPSAPTTEPWFQSARVRFDGTDVDGLALFGAEKDTAYVEIHMDVANNFTVVAPGISGSTFIGEFRGPGTWNEPDLAYDTAYYFRLVAVDRAGNRSVPSATSAPVIVRQLVNIDIGPDAIDRTQIIDGEIVNAKIADLAVNNAKISDLNVGKLVSGTVAADMILAAGEIRSGADPDDYVVQDSGGLRMVFGGVTKVDISRMTGDALLVGTYRTALTGARFELVPPGEMRIYGATSGSNYGALVNDGGTWRAVSRPDGTGRRSVVDFDPNGFTASYGTASASGVFTQVRSSFTTGETYGVLTAGVVGTRVDRRFTPTDSTSFRAFWTHSTNGTPSGDIEESVLHYIYGNESVAIVAPGLDVGVRWDNTTGNVGDGRVYITDSLGVQGGGSDANMRHLTCRSLTQTSSAGTKRDITSMADGLPSVGSLRDLVRQVRARAWKPREYDLPARRVRINEVKEMIIPATPPDQVPTQFGLIAEELEAVAPELVHRVGRDGNILTIAPMEIASVAWQVAAEAHDAIDALRAEIAALRDRPAPGGPRI